MTRIEPVTRAEVERCLTILDRDDIEPDPPQPLDPCWQCQAPAIKRLMKRSYCGTHLAALYTTFNPAVWQNGGVGLPSGLQHPEYGPGIEDLTCCRCGATWASICGDRCQWCIRSLELQREHQAELILRVPDVNPSDATYDSRMAAWAQRIGRGVATGLITEQQALNAGRRIDAA